MTGISNQFSKGKPSCQKFGTQMCLSVGWGPPTLELAVTHYLSVDKYLSVSSFLVSTITFCGKKLGMGG